jgi:hypothetical protein
LIKPDHLGLKLFLEKMLKIFYLFKLSKTLNKMSTDTNDNFHNPMYEQAKKNMTKEQLEEYKKKGEDMYGDMDFDTAGKDGGASTDPLRSTLKYIELGLNSGLHPSEVTLDEKNILIQFYDEKWYEKWGYTKDDVK